MLFPPRLCATAFCLINEHDDDNNELMMMMFRVIATFKLFVCHTRADLIAKIARHFAAKVSSNSVF